MCVLFDFLFPHRPACSFFFFNDTATTEIYTLSLHDALPICARDQRPRDGQPDQRSSEDQGLSHPRAPALIDRKSTRLNSSHSQISYAVFCLKKKKTKKMRLMQTVQSI